MRLDDLRPSDNVEDRRGEGGGGFGGGGFGPRMVFGGGGLGLVVVLVLSLFFGVDPSQLLNGGPEPQTRQDSGPRADDADYEFARRVIGSAEDVWQPLLRDRGVHSPRPLSPPMTMPRPPAAVPANPPPGLSIVPVTRISIWTSISSVN